MFSAFGTSSFKILTIEGPKFLLKDKYTAIFYHQIQKHKLSIPKKSIFEMPNFLAS